MWSNGLKFSDTIRLISLAWPFQLLSNLTVEQKPIRPGYKVS